LNRKKSYSYKLTFFFFGLIFISNCLLAQEIDQNYFDADNRLLFGNHLFCELDYLRAISEYNAYLQQKNSDSVRFKIAHALQEMGRYEESIDQVKSLFFNSEFEESSRLSFYKSHFLKKDYENFRMLTERQPYVINEIKQPLKKLTQVSYLIENTLPDSTLFLNAFANEEKEVMLKFYLERKYPDYKSESTAGLLSALIPGLGKIYADQTGDGITSFLLTGVLGFLAYSNFENDHPTRAWIFTGLATYFYAGNIYGSMAAAQNYNAAVNFSFDAELNFYLKEKEYFIPKPEFLCD
jgi:TM2 domain-containing membrane protein YozV